MRPKKVVLCVAANEQTLSLRMFQLETWGYLGVRASTASEALGILERSQPNTIDLLLIHHPLPGGDALLTIAKRHQPEIKTVVLSDKLGFDGNIDADMYVPKGAAPMEIHAGFRSLLARKRGPKKAVASVGVAQKEVRYG